MISYDNLWNVMKEKGISQYALIKKYNVSPAQITRLKRNESVSTHTIETLPDGDFTRDDLAALGYGPKAISNLRRDKLIVDTGRRTPERKFIFRKNFV